MTIALTEEIVKSLFPKCKDVKEYVAAFNQLLTKNGINSSKKRLAAFLGQYGYETGGWTALVENTCYTTPERLMKKFPNKFPSLYLAKLYAGKAVNIANRVYAGRYGNGDENSGDGYRYRGRGACHLTFKDNYTAFFKATGVDVIQHPEFLEEPWYAVLAGEWYWTSHHLNDVADKWDIAAITKAVNGGSNGLEDRIALSNKILEKLNEMG